MEQIESEPRKISARLVWLGALLGVGALALLVFGLSNGQAASPAVSANLFVLLPAAFVAGVLSFLSPCTLPILPAYFAFSFQADRKNVVMMTVAFFLGLATTITLLGASATALSLLLLQHLRQLTLIGGLAVMAFGVMSLLGKGFAGPQFQDRPATTLVGSYLYGATFALGWTACVGPILGAILTLLATQGAGIAQGAVLAFVYALGLGAPLIVISTLFSRLGHGTRFWQILKGRGFEVKLGGQVLYLHTTSILSGLLLIGMGYLLASGQLTFITQLAAGSDISLWVVDMEENLRTLFGLR
ncbi:MAG: cytochrome c biogenesis CcdA family protein [Chloroflexota bacterium]